jgi:hypothetical protein
VITPASLDTEISYQAPVIFYKVQAVEPNGKTIALRLWFSEDIAGLRAENILLGANSTGITRGTLSKLNGQNGIYDLAVSGVKQIGQVPITVSKAGVIIQNNTQSVGVDNLGLVNIATPSLKAKFGITQAGRDGVDFTLTHLHWFITLGGLTSDPTAIQLGDYIDLEGGLAVEAYGDGGGNFSYSGSNQNTRLIVVGINSFHSGRGRKEGGNGTTVNGETNGQYSITANDATPHVVFHFQKRPLSRRMDPNYTLGGNYRDSEMRQYVLQKFLPGLIDAGVPEYFLWAPKRYVSTRGGSAEIQDKLWIPTEKEIYQDKNSSPNETAQNQARLEYYSDSATLNKGIYFLATPTRTEIGWHVADGDGVYITDGYSVFGCVPAFCIW